MWDRLKSLPLTIFLSILIWMYAEAQFTTTREGVNILLRVAPPSNEYAVRVLDARDGRFRNPIPLGITVQGPQAQVDRLYNLSIGNGTDSEFANLVYQLSATELTEPELNTVQVLNRTPYFRNHGLTVIGGQPVHLRLDVDRMMRVMRPIQVRTPGAPEAQILSVTPAQAEVQVPQTVLGRIGGPEQITVYAVPMQELSNLQPGTKQTVAATLTVEYSGAKDERVTATPQPVMVEVRAPEQRESTVAVPGVPVQTLGYPASFAAYQVVVTPKFVNLTLAGSDQALESIRAALAKSQSENQPLPLVAYVDVGLGDRPTREGVETPLHYSLPAGVTIKEGPKTVKVRLVDPNAPATAPTPTTAPATAR